MRSRSSAVAQKRRPKVDAQWRLAEEGFRKEEISSAKAELDAVESNLALARKTEDRQLKLWKANATTAQNVDNARWSRIVLEKQAASARAVYELKVAGLRPDEVRQTKAALDAGRAAVDSLTYQIETAAVLVSPVNGVVRTRMAEPGDMASAARTVYQISIMDPKWVRAYVSETQLKYVQEGAEALVTTDTTEPLKARVGHISSEGRVHAQDRCDAGPAHGARLRGEAQRRGSGQPPASRPARDRGLRALNPPLEEKHVMTTSVIEASALCRVFCVRGRTRARAVDGVTSPYRPRLVVALIGPRRRGQVDAHADDLRARGPGLRLAQRARAHSGPRRRGLRQRRGLHAADARPQGTSPSWRT